MSENAQRGPTAERGPIRDGRTAPFMLINMRYMYGPLTTIPGVPVVRRSKITRRKLHSGTRLYIQNYINKSYGSASLFHLPNSNDV